MAVVGPVGPASNKVRAEAKGTEATGNCFSLGSAIGSNDWTYHVPRLLFLPGLNELALELQTTYIERGR